MIYDRSTKMKVKSRQFSSICKELNEYIDIDSHKKYGNDCLVYFSSLHILSFFLLVNGVNLSSAANFIISYIVLINSAPSINSILFVDGLFQWN